MQRLLKWIIFGIFIGWTLAILVNFPIYQNLTEQLTLIDPIVDGILFMLLMVGIYLLVWKTYQRKKANANFQLVTVGTISMVLAIVLLF